MLGTNSGRPGCSFISPSRHKTGMMATTVSGFWTDFIKTGDPNGGDRPEWRPYNPSTRDVMSFTAAGAAFGADPLKQRLDLWQEVWDPRR